MTLLMVFFIFLVITALLFYGFFLLLRAEGRREQRRLKAIRAICAVRGFQFDQGPDPAVVQEYANLTLFQEGRERHATHLIRGNYKNVPFHAFEYQYETKTKDREGEEQTHHHWFFCAVINLPKPLPHIWLRPEHIFDKMLATVGFDDIDFESYQFSKTFHVSSKNRRVAYDFFHPQMQEHCLSRNDLNLEVEGRRLMIYIAGDLKPEELIDQLDLLLGVADLIPKHLLNDKVSY